MATLKTNQPHREAGQAIVELALTLPLLLLVVLGIFDFGLMFERYEVITNAAREGARVAVLPAPFTTGMAVTRTNDYLASGGVTGATVNVSQSTITVATTPTTKTVDVMVVTVTYAHQHVFVGPIMSLFGGALGSTQLTAVSKMRKEPG